MATMNQVGVGLSGATGTGNFVGSTAPALLLPSANNFISGYATTATATATTTLVAGSAYQQFFTGTLTQNVDMPVTSTITIGQSWLIVNNSNQIITVRSSGGNNILAMPAGTNSHITCIAQAGTTASDWNAEGVSGVAGVDSITGTANQVIASAATGPVTLSLPQSIATTSNPTFAALTLTSVTFGGSVLSTYTASTNWTPTVTFATPGDVGVVYNVRTANYSRIGNILVVNFNINFDLTYTTAAGAFQITGLPAANNATVVATGTAISGSTTIYPVGATNILSTIAASASLITITPSGSASSFAPLSVTQLTTGATYAFSGTITYMV